MIVHAIGRLRSLRVARLKAYEATKQPRTRSVESHILLYWYGKKVMPDVRNVLSGSGHDRLPAGRAVGGVSHHLGGNVYRWFRQTGNARGPPRKKLFIDLSSSMARSVALIAVLLAAVATAATPPKPSLAVRRTGVVENCGGRSMLVSAKVLVRD